VRLTDATLQAGQTVLGGCVGVEEMLPGYRRFLHRGPLRDPARMHASDL